MEREITLFRFCACIGACLFVLLSLFACNQSKPEGRFATVKSGSVKFGSDNVNSESANVSTGSAGDSPASISSSVSKYSSASKYSKGWAPNPEHVELLRGTAQPPDAIIPFKLSFPSGYSSFMGRNYIAQSFFFSGAPRSNRTKPSFLISLIPKQAGQNKQDSIEDALKAAVEATKKMKTRGWKVGPVENGKIDGVTFVRQYWQGVDPSSKLNTKGFFYLGKQGETLILMSSQDTEPYCAESLPLAESAILSMDLN